MSITLDFLLLFFLFIIPGLVFKRAFFYKEFSKQFSIKDNAYTIIFFSFIPGLIFQVLGFFIYWIVHEPDYTLHDILISLKGVVNKKDSIVPVDLSVFIIHQLLVNLLACCSGFLISRLIRYFGLDIKFKFFRFSNQWYYIFSGEIESFEKFKNFRNRVNLNIIGRNDFKFMPPIADILVEGNDGQKLYSGYLIDYDLNPKDIHALDKVYLKYAYRYRSAREDDDSKMIIRKTAKVPIPGDIFILNTDSIISMNLTFVPTPIEQIEKKNERKNSILRWIYTLGVGINIYILLDILLFDMYALKFLIPEKFSNPILLQPWYVRILVASIINLIFSFLFPIQNEKTKIYSYKKWLPLFAAKIILIAAFGGLSYLLWK
ncbi:MAG: hypothetical protein JJT77_04975 [Crocinitomicaceae bacterium]|nr:hypothetical protein [Crocinitomicaceae bacterium]